MATQAAFGAWLEYFAEGILDELLRVEKTLPRHQRRIADRHRVIFDYLENNGSITQREYSMLTAGSLPARKQDFAKLVDMGLIDAVGQGRGRHYRLSDQ